MKKKGLYIGWFALYLATVVIGSIEPGNALAKAMMVLLAICFFIPPGVLLYDGLRRGDRQQVLLLRLVSSLSLGLSFVLMVVNFLSTPMSQGAGDVVYALLIVVSAPMACGQYWVVSLFAWACIWMTTMLYAPKKK